MHKRKFIKLSSLLMAGSIITPEMAVSQEKRPVNWAGNLTYSTGKVLVPRTVPEVQQMVSNAKSLKVQGTRHCFNTIADSRDTLLMTAGLDKVISLDKQARLVTVESGIRYGQLAVYLEKEGFALHNLASLPHISVAGACATATHGSGDGNGNLATAVTALEMVTGTGELVTISRDKDPSIFYGAVVGLGALGIVTKMTLEVQPTYAVRQDVYENMPMSVLKENFEDIFSAGYSVSIFTDWRNKNLNEIWIKRKTIAGDTLRADPEWLGAKAATRNLHPIAELSAVNCTDQMGVPGPWHERLPHFKMGFTPSSGKELQSEYFVPRKFAYDAIMAVERLNARISPLLQITEIRTIAADQLWMSPCYQTPGVTIHFTWQQDWPNVSKLLPLIEREIYPYQAKPHWGKLFTIPGSRMKQLYEKHEDFTKLTKTFDPKGRFLNDFLRKNVLTG